MTLADDPGTHAQQKGGPEECSHKGTEAGAGGTLRKCVRSTDASSQNTRGDTAQETTIAPRNQTWRTPSSHQRLNVYSGV
jgi:hypothetical protein